VTTEIVNCFVEDAVVEANQSSVGGLVGYFWSDGSGFIHNSYARDVEISATSYAGGLAGQLYAVDVHNCYATGSITVTNSWSDVGGLIGYYSRAAAHEVTISNSYARVDVRGHTQNIGGFIGRLFNGEIYDSYSTGRVTASSDAPVNFGGFVGQFGDPEDNMDGCYWDTQTSGVEDNGTGCVASGRMTRQMVYPYDHQTYVRWDFEDTWFDDYRFGPVNDGYPILFYQHVYLDTPEITNVSRTTVGGEEYIFITWDEIEDAESYIIFAHHDPATDASNWGDPVAITADNEYLELIGEDNRQMFYFIIASGLDPDEGRSAVRDRRRTGEDERYSPQEIRRRADDRRITPVSDERESTQEQRRRESERE